MLTRSALFAGLLLIATQSVRAQCLSSWTTGPLDNGTLPSGVNGNNVRAAAAWDPDGLGPLPEHLVIGGDFNQVQGLPINHLAMWNTQSGQWKSFDEFGLNPLPRVIAIKVVNGELFILTERFEWDNPSFNSVTTTLRQWSSATASWITLAAFEFSYHDRFHALGEYNGQLVIAGTFTMLQGDPQISGIARWDGAQFHPLGQGLTGSVKALTQYNGELIAAGYLEPTGQSTIDNIARWNGSIWQGLSSGPTTNNDLATISALTVYNGELIAGGDFTLAGGAPASCIARWNGSTWQELGGGIDGFWPAVFSLAVHSGQLIAGGSFETAGGVAAQSIARWNGTMWQSLGSGLASPDAFFDPSALALTSIDGLLIVGGSFFVAGGVPATNLARWNGSTWSKFGGGSASAVFGFTNFVSGIVAGGLFQQTTAELGTSNIISFDGVGLRPLGTGMNDAVNTVETFTYPGPFGEHELIAGGWFTAAGGVAANRIARWQEDPASAFPPPAWQAMGAGFNNAVMAIERFNGQTYAAGAFTQSGATAVNRIARWNEVSDTWEPLLGGLDGTVYAIKEYNGALYVGGAFNNASGASTGKLARWNGSSWSSVTGIFGGAGFGVVYALEVHNGELIIGGEFSWVGSPNLVKYNSVTGMVTSMPNAFPAGTDGTVRAVTVADGKLHIGGSFTTVANVSANRMAVWDGSTWSAVDGGADNTIYALAEYHSEVHAGGIFETVNSADPVTTKAWARLLVDGVPWFAHHPVGQSRDCGSDATFVAHLAAGYAPTAHQWLRNGMPLVAGSTPSGSIIAFDESNLTIANLSQADAGDYALVITNSCGSVISNSAALTISGSCCPGDVDNNGAVDVDDLIAVILGWGACPAPPTVCAADVNGSGAVDVDDLIAIILGWGPCR